MHPRSHLALITVNPEDRRALEFVPSTDKGPLRFRLQEAYQASAKAQELANKIRQPVAVVPVFMPEE